MSCVGQKAAPMRGQGRKRALTNEQEAQVIAMYSETEVPVNQIAVAFGVCKKTIYNILARARESAAHKNGNAAGADTHGG